MSTKASFEHVMSGLQSGDDEAAAKLHQRFAAQLIGLAQKRLKQRYRSKFDPDDVVQSAFHSFFRRHAEGQFEFNGWENIWSLLANITIRKCGRRVQAFKSAKRDIDRESAENKYQGVAVGISREPTPEDAALLEETLERLFLELTADQQQVLVLKLQNYSNEEISEHIGRTERTVYRVLTLIRQRLEEMDQPPAS